MEVLKIFKTGKRISCFVAKMQGSYIVKTGRPSNRHYTWVTYFGTLDDAISYATKYNEYCKTYINSPNINDYPSLYRWR